MDRGASALQGNLQSSEGASFVRGRSWLVRLQSASAADRGRRRPNARSASAEPERSAQVKIYSVYSKQARDVLTRFVCARGTRVVSPDGNSSEISTVTFLPVLRLLKISAHGISLKLVRDRSTSRAALAC